MGRLAEADESANALLAEVYAHIKKTRGRVSNSLKSLGHSPEGLKRFAALGEFARFSTGLSGRTQEMVALTIARDSQYAWIHHRPSALKAGMKQHEIEEIYASKVPETVSAAEAAALRYAGEFRDHGRVTDGTFERLKEHYSERQITDMTLIAAFFLGFVAIINPLAVELEPEFR